MADIAFLKKVLAHTLKDIERVDEGTKPMLRRQADRIREQIGVTADHQKFLAKTSKRYTKKPKAKKRKSRK